MSFEKYSTEILADYSVAADVPGNKLTLDAELVTTKDDHQVGIGLTFNTAHDDELDTEVYIQLPLEKAAELSNVLKGFVHQAAIEKLAMAEKVIEFKTAQLACAKGLVGGLRITKIADSDHGDVVGFGYYTLEFLDDQAEPVVLHTVENIECYVPPMEEAQYEWLRTLVGGNHTYTPTIKVQLVDFTFAEITAEFDNHIGARLAKG
jgi:hypothetical protein